MKKKNEKFDMGTETMRDVRDSLSRGEGLNNDPYPYENPKIKESSQQSLEKKKGCLSILFGLFG